MRKLLLLVPLTLLSFTVPYKADALAAPVPSFWGGVNGVWYDSQLPAPKDFELGGNAAVSLQPHISLVGAGYFGFAHSYLRGSSGVRFTISNPDDQRFSIGLGAQYHFSSEPAIRAEGLAYDASLGVLLWPVEAPDVSLVLQGSYSPSTNQASVIAGVRYLFGGDK